MKEKKWEYVIIDLDNYNDKYDYVILDELGEKGWEAFAVEGRKVFMKRPKED